MCDDGNVTNLIHSATMSVGQPASVDGLSRVIAVSARPTISVRNMPQPYLASSGCRRSSGPGVIRMSAQFKRCADLAWCVMTVNPDFMMVMPAPMSRNPNPINPTDVIAWAMYIIRPVTYFDIHNNSICHGRHCYENCQKYSNFSFHTR